MVAKWEAAAKKSALRQIREDTREQVKAKQGLSTAYVEVCEFDRCCAFAFIPATFILPSARARPRCAALVSSFRALCLWWFKFKVASAHFIKRNFSSAVSLQVKICSMLDYSVIMVVPYVGMVRLHARLQHALPFGVHRTSGFL